jgi:L-alanine-DL-glutamate epimerase-like enolase superfamily enzyme
MSEDYRIPQGGGVPWRDLSADHRRAEERDVAITDVRTMRLAGNFNWGIVKVETDADVYGIGETYRAPQGLLEFAEGLLVDLEGENPLDVTRLLAKLNQNYTGCGRIGQGAFTGVEMALWDLKGKLLDVPVYELLGGKFRDEVRVYCDTHGGEGLGAAESGASPREIYTPESYARAAREVVDAGFSALKFDLDVKTRADVDTAARRLDNDAVEHKVALVEAVREEIGYEIDLGMDLHWNFTVETAARLGEKLDPYDLAWLEDPVHPDNVEGHRRVREAVSSPVLTGENLHRAAEFEPYVQAGALDIAAPDVCKCGGLSAFTEIAQLCERHGVAVSPHNVASPVGTVAGAHVGAAVPNLFAVEYHAFEVPWWEDLVDRTGESGGVIENGTIDVPEGPGLGIEIDPDVAAEHLLDGEVIV